MQIGGIMKKVIKILGILLVVIFVLTGCSNKGTNSKKKLRVEGNVFQSTTINRGKKLNKQLDFRKDNKIVLMNTDYSQETHHWYRDIVKGSYEKSGNKIIVHYKKGYTEEYTSKKALNAMKLPYRISSDDENVKVLHLKLNDDSLKVTDKHNSKVEYKLVKDSKHQDYGKLIDSHREKYNKKYATLSGRGFMSPATEMSENGIAFKGDRFIWHYGAPNNDYNSGLDIGAQVAIFEGSYKVVNNRLQLFIDGSTNIFCGTVRQLGNKEFIDYYSSSDTPKELDFSFTENSTLTLLKSKGHITSEEMMNYGTVAGTPNFDTWDVQNKLESFDRSMHQGVKSTSDSESKDDTSDTTDQDVKDVFPTKEDFANWVGSVYPTLSGNDEDSPFTILDSYEGGTIDLREQIDSPIVEESVIYSVSYSTTESDENSDAPDIARNISITSDGKIYSGHFNTYDDELTQAYLQMNS